MDSSGHDGINFNAQIYVSFKHHFKQSHFCFFSMFLSVPLFAAQQTFQGTFSPFGQSLLYSWLQRLEVWLILSTSTNKVDAFSQGYIETKN